ncbi:LOW QUALITY PROTEIN: hypothetical protein Cgig2_028076 [Carnegiea gigantea]|uniref:Uncharacterized protein n=1 Tax=Carnegiea gigantea TaxID=171969 RepID=A0A9Q1JEE4_9CARY|nr:LOW QUALITY PROTEIN: hypothetical protein Cgig2_028076 [Carnegiea gigantea]
MINGYKNDTASEVQYWSNVVISVVMGANPSLDGGSEEREEEEAQWYREKENVENVPNKLFGGWHWTTNVDTYPKVRIRVALKAPAYGVTIMLSTEHTRQGSIGSHPKAIPYDFYVWIQPAKPKISIIGGPEVICNKHDALHVLGDFNAVLHYEERIGGADITHVETIDFSKCLEDYELQKTRTTWAFYTSANKSVWFRIDRECEYVHVTCKPEGLSDQKPLVLSFFSCPRKKTGFKYCEIKRSTENNTRIAPEGPCKSIPPRSGKRTKRTLSSYAYSIQDEHGNEVKGFAKVGHIMTKFYKELLGKSARKDPIVVEVI